jgi:trehalose 2-sulfotransferase
VLPGISQDLLDSDRDMQPPRDPSPPTRSYIVCSTPRSGSGLLCRGLASTLVAGTPLEYFDPGHRELLRKRWGCGRRLEPYLAELYSRRTTSEGVFGVKLHWGQLVTLRAEALGTSASEPEYGASDDFIERLFPNATYFRTLRRDLNRQAVSLWFSLHTGTWSVATEDRVDGRDRARVPFSYEGIDRCRRLIERSELHWDRFLRANGIEPVDLVYEELVEDYPETVVSALRKVVPGADGAPVPPIPTTQRLSDEHSEQFLVLLARDRERCGPPDPVGFTGFAARRRPLPSERLRRRLVRLRGSLLRHQE